MSIIQKANGTNKAFGDNSRIVLDTIMQKINQVEEQTLNQIYAFIIIKNIGRINNMRATTIL